MGSNVLCKRTYDMLCDIYKKGTRVEAISVMGVDTCARGNVRGVMKNGDVKVNFDKFGEITVQYPEEVIRVVYSGNGCILGLKRGKKRYVECWDDCSGCGWNPVVDKARKQAIADGEMVVKKGIKRLVLNRT